MEKPLQTFRYLSRSFVRLTLIGFFTILCSVAIVDLIFTLTDRRNAVHPVVTLTGPFELTAGIFVFIISSIFFIPNFKVALANGITRKTFLPANLPIAALVAASLSLFSLIVVQIHSLFWPIIFLSNLYYPSYVIGWSGILIFQFVLNFLMIAAGWFVTLTYYRCSVPGKWAISLSPLGLYVMLRIANAYSNGATFIFLKEYILESVWWPTIVFTLLTDSVILCGLVYLLVRRMPLKD